ncbi:hypothetical protein [Pseudomonas aeruginosa]|uniref:hypothetical protein n=1 Tax=Pseudomonas aeruginosa TaxID=287 RepID=UPI00215D817A|nr:hypothetical protein [Pseudomonas aeruginosa]
MASTCSPAHRHPPAPGESALVELTGLRNPCSQLDNYQPGLTAAVLGRDEQATLFARPG